MSQSAREECPLGLKRSDKLDTVNMLWSFGSGRWVIIETTWSVVFGVILSVLSISKVIKSLLYDNQTVEEPCDKNNNDRK